MPGRFLSAGYVKLPLPVSERITEQDIVTGRAFDRRWLIEQGQPASTRLWKLVNTPWLKSFLNRVTPAGATWNGMNSSTWTESRSEERRVGKACRSQWVAKHEEWSKK